LEQYERAMVQGLRFDWLTFDEGYGGKPEFLRELSAEAIVGGGSAEERVRLGEAAAGHRAAAPHETPGPAMAPA